MKTMFRLLAIAILVVLGVYLLFPMSPSSSYSRAEKEIISFCFDMKMNCKRFKSVGIIKDDGSVRVYQWNDIKKNNLIHYVSVPYRRIGDFTFGQLGQEVSLTSNNKQN